MKKGVMKYFLLLLVIILIFSVTAESYGDSATDDDSELKSPISLIVDFFKQIFSGGGKAPITGDAISGIVEPELPRIYVDTTMPTQTGQTITVNSGGNLQTALNNAQPGDTIILQAGATFTGTITLPAKSNPSNKWIVIKSSALGSLPPEGQRVKPSDAGNMPKIVTTNSGFAIDSAQGASYYRFIGIEVTDTGTPDNLAPAFPDGSKGSFNYGLIELGRGGRDTQISHLPHHIVFDRSYIHAQPKTSSRRGVVFNGAHQAVIDSYVSDFKEASAAGGDSQAIAGWNGVGPFKIVNNFLEASAENVMFGGSDPSLPNAISSDIEIRGNYFYKPLSWNSKSPNYVGVQWTIKNLFEIKNAQRIILEGNVFEGSWSQAQTGWAMILKSSNQAGACTWCVGKHVTIRNNIFRNAGAGINLQAKGDNGAMEGLNHILIENNILENIPFSPYYTGDNRMFQVLVGVTDVIIRNNTATSPGGLTSALVLDKYPINNLEFTNNIATYGQYGIIASGLSPGESVFSKVVSGTVSYSGNVLVGPIKAGYPSFQFVPDLAAAKATGKGANEQAVLSATRGAVSGIWGACTDTSWTPSTTNLCGAVSQISNCGNTRTIQGGITCQTGQTCTNNVCSSSCINTTWTPSPTNLCGSVTQTSNCGNTRTIQGGITCQTGQTCTNNQCTTSSSTGIVELPRVYVDTTMPTQTGQTITVNSGGNLQTALNNAQPGDTIVLEAGATFTGNFILPLKSNPNNKWIIIKSSNENLLPPQGTRVKASDAVNMPTITTSNGVAPLATAPSTNGWRLIGLEITIPSTYTGTNYGLLMLGDISSAQNSLSLVPYNIVVDRSYIHGQPNVTVRRCIALHSGSTAIIDSAITECHEKGSDSQAIFGANGPGPYKISNNLLEGAGENILFGGADPKIPNLVPSDIEISRNYFHKPISAWGPAGIGLGPWTEKNLLEIKNAERVLIENNVFSGSWSDGQSGGGILLRSSNQGGGCRWCRGTNIIFRHNLIKDVSSGIAVAGDGNVDTPAEKIYITENVIEAGLYSGNRWGLVTLGIAAKDITFERNVVYAAPGGTLNAPAFIEGGSICTFRDNVWEYGTSGLIGSGVGGINALNKYCGTNGWIWENMTFIGPAKGTYPPSTTFVSSESNAPLATQIRSIVSSATRGAISGIWGPCTDTTWTPSATNLCGSVTQTSNCGNTRIVPGGVQCNVGQVCVNNVCTSGQDTTPPTAAVTAPSTNQIFPAGTTSVTLSVTTNEAATCKYSTTNQIYGDMPNTMVGVGTTSHTSTLTSLQNNTSYTQYVRCADTAGNAMTNSANVLFSVANSLTVCDLTSASWSKNNSVEGDVVYLNVFGNNCNGKNISFEIKERDIIGDDPVRINPLNVIFGGASASGTWIAEWQDDGLLGLAEDPEYYFIASVVGSNESVQSGTGNSELLKVSKLPNGTLGEKFVVGMHPVNDRRDRMFIVSITNQTTIQEARNCYTYGQQNPSDPRCGPHINGQIASGNGGFNTNWNWHLLPDTVRMVDVSMEVCDGVPSDVERDGVNFDAGRFCPYSSYILALGDQYPTPPSLNDTMPPVATINSPIERQQFPAGTTSVTLSVITNEVATCKYNDVGGNYDSMIYTLNGGGTTSHTTILSNLQNGTNYVRYVRCKDTAGNAMNDSEGVRFSIARMDPICGDNICNEDETSASCVRDCPISICGDKVCNETETSTSCIIDCPYFCDLTSASWSNINSVEGETVYLNVLGNSCDLKTISFEVREYDVVANDHVKVNPLNVIFNGNSIKGSWVTEWQEEGLGESDPPEYYFIASVVGTGEEIKSGKGDLDLLYVTKIGSSFCGDKICNGAETSSTCSTDCPQEDSGGGWRRWRWRK